MRLISRENKKTKKIKNKISPIDYQKNITVSESGENEKKEPKEDHSTETENESKDK